MCVCFGLLVSNWVCVSVSHGVLKNVIFLFLATTLSQPLHLQNIFARLKNYSPKIAEFWLLGMKNRPQVSLDGCCFGSAQFLCINNSIEGLIIVLLGN